jgi:glycine reductase
MSSIQRELETERGGGASVLADRVVIALGERDGISGPAIEACVRAAGGKVAFGSTECFV